jgi:hypothetical protein
MTLRLILLDRNAVDAVKRCVSGSYVDSIRRRQLEGLDKSRNFVTPILSVIEGQSGKRETKEAIRATLKKEAAAVGAFFKRARTDSDYFLSDEVGGNFADVFGIHIEHSWERYILFVREVYPLLYQPISSRSKCTVEDQLFGLAKKHDVQVSHPVFLVSLAVLYGHDGARKTLKPKAGYDSIEQEESAAYNAVSDLIVISRIAMIRSVLRDDEKRFGYVRFFTFDKGLLSFINATTIAGETALPDGSVSVNVTYNRKLFPDLDDAAYESLIRRLGVIA